MARRGAHPAHGHGGAHTPHPGAWRGVTLPAILTQSGHPRHSSNMQQLFGFLATSGLSNNIFDNYPFNNISDHYSFNNSPSDK